MELNLLAILNFDGRKMQISEDVPIVSEAADSFSVTEPVHFDGYALNVGGTIELCGKATAHIKMVCDRCAEQFDKTIEFEIDERLKKEDALSGEDENPDVIAFSGTAVDFSEIVYTNLYMNLPSKTLCSEDCKGLCPVCGKNLNLGSCDCSTERTDPRFDVLEKFL